MVSIPQNYAPLQVVHPALLGRIQQSRFKVSHPHVSSTVQQYSHVPQELKAVRQWVVWSYGNMRPNGKRAKEPYTPHHGGKAKVNDPTTWSTYLEALLAYMHGGYTGIGFVFTEQDPFFFIDLDGTTDASLLDHFSGTYAEISPSGYGVKIIGHGKLPANHGTPPIECYDHAKFSTITGQTIQAVPTLVDQQTALDVWYQETYPAKEMPQITTNEHNGVVLRDGDVLKLAKRNRKFEPLWNGDTSCYPSSSEADYALCGILAFYTQDADQLERIARRSGLVREKWNTHPTYLVNTIHKAIQKRTGTYSPRIDRRIRYDLAITGGRQLVEVRNQVRNDLQACFESSSQEVTLINAPCGVGKSQVAAELGASTDVAWIAERHDMVDQVSSLAQYRHIQPPAVMGCPEPEKHAVFSSLGYSTWHLHKEHGCEYIEQFNEKGSAVYMVQHAQTYYPTNHKAIIIDEFNPFSWIVEAVITARHVQEARNRLGPPWKADTLLRAIYRVIGDVKRGETLHDKALFDAISKEVLDLRQVVEDVAEDEMLMIERPKPPTVSEEMPRIVLPAIVKAMKNEIEKWSTGNDWNGCIRIEQDRGEAVLKILRPRQFQGYLPMVILDATGDERIMSLLLGRPVKTTRYEVQPPQGMRHIAVRTGKRYSKYQLYEAPSAKKDLARVVKEVRYLLGDVDLSTVGLITYKDIEDELGKALGIRRTGHFYNVRGSNAFEACETLVVVGTPCPNLGDVVWLARMLYQDDPKPIETSMNERHRYQDERLRGMVDYLVKAELTQVCHRNRPLVYNNRTVISLCDAEIDFLPVTEQVTQLPNLK